VFVSALVEGATDEIVARRIVEHCDHEFAVCYGKHGVGYILQRLGGFAAAATYGPPLLVMVDLMDTGIACARDLVPALLPDRPALCILRGVVRELESWLLADREAIATFLGLSVARVPADPEALLNPKQSFINLARHCRKRSRRDAIVPADGVNAATGPDYLGAVAELVRDHWDVTRASAVAPSLARCVARLREIPADD
jgi:hypothetical protein